MVRRGLIAGLVAGALALTAQAAAAQTKITVGTSANAEVAALFVAKQEGIFEKNGIDASIEIIALNPTLPASLLSDSLQIGAVTPTVFIQAVDNGLDLSAIGGVSVVNPGMARVYLVAAPGEDLSKPADFVGKTVAVPGLNAILHIALQLWFQNHDVDPAKVTFVEAPLATVGDLLKSNKVNASIVVDPFLTRIEQANGGTLVAPFLVETLEGKQTHFYTATTAWAEANPEAVAGFRKSLGEAAEFIASNPEKAREDINVFLKLPPEAIARLSLPKSKITVEAADVQFFADTMKSFGLASGAVDPAKHVVD